jgi:hypothetical protein
MIPTSIPTQAQRAFAGALVGSNLIPLRSEA